MLSSSYYWKMFREKKAEAKQHKKNREYLDKTVDGLDQDYDNNASTANKKLLSCRNSLPDGVRHVDSISQRLDELDDIREQMPDCDSAISGATNALQREIKDLQRKEDEAERQAEEFSRLAMEAEGAELASLVSSIIGGE